MAKEHHYQTTITWTGNLGKGTSEYAGYDRDHVISVGGKPEIAGSSDPAFRGKKDRYTPEDTFLSSISACHMLWYLHLCAVNHVIVEKYTDNAEGIMNENPDGSGEFVSVTLKPVVTVRSQSMADKARSLHHEANRMCFIARSLNFKVLHQPEIHIL